MPSHPDVQLALLTEQRRREFREVADFRAATHRPGAPGRSLLTAVVSRFRTRPRPDRAPEPVWRMPSRVPGATVRNAAS